MEHLLAVRGLEAGYDKRPVLHGISVEMPPGDLVALVGPNGAGKSTLLKAIFGLVRASRGTIALGGRQIQNRNPSRNVRDGLSYVPQGSRVFTELSVRENLEVGGHTLQAREVKDRVEEVLSFFPDLRPLQTRNAATLSTGEKQMLAMARALMLKPALLLADEPSLGLGPRLAHAALAHLRDLNHQSGTAILLVEQNVREALAIARHVYVLKLGRIVLADRPENLTHEALRQAFLSW
jgi:branched-chain amino acid transport system ATP-binding protein